MKINPELYSDLTSSSVGESYEGFEVVESYGWEVDGKYENLRVIVQHVESGKFYALHETRSGSYFSDYHYEDYDLDENGLVELEEVEAVERLIVEYV